MRQRWERRAEGESAQDDKPNRQLAMDGRDPDRGLAQLAELTDYAVPYGDGAEWRAVRERARNHQTHPQDLAMLDMVVSGVALWPGLLDDDPARPPADWWWHLGAIRAGTYPADLLPPHLRETYRAGHSRAAQSPP